MNEQAILDAYNLFVQNGYTKSLDEYKKLIASNPQALQDSYSLFAENGYKKTVDDFKLLMGVGAQVPQKKKFDTVSASADGSLVLPKTERAVAESTAMKPRMIAPVKEAPLDEVDYFEGAFGDVLRGFDKIVPLGIGDLVDDVARSVAQGRRQGIAAKEADRLLVKGSKATPEEIQKFIETQKQIGQLGESAEVKEYNKIYEEEGGGIWGALKGLALNPSYIPQILFSSMSAMANNADALTAGAAAVGTGAGIGATTGATGGTVALPVIGTIGGAAAGAASGAAASLPYAFGLASSVVELGSKFGELLTEELQGKPMTKENVKAILEDPDKLQSMRNKAIVRGAIIGTFDTYTGKIAGSVGAKILTKSAAKSATGAATKAAVTRATAAGAGIEALGGSAGEATAKAALGEEMDASDILLEGIADLPGGIRSTIQARLAKPSYTVNGEKVDAAQVDELINTMTPEQLAQAKIDIKNDYEGRNFKIQDKIVTGQIKKEVQQANPDVDEATIDQLVDLEKELKKFEENKTQSGKDKAASIRTQIKEIQENATKKEGNIPEAISSLKDNEEVAFTVKTLEEVPEQFRDRAVKKEGMQVEIRETILGLPIGKKTTTVVNDGYTYKLTGKEAKDYAIQKQAAGQVPVQPTTGSRQEVAQGKPQAGPQVVTAEGVQETITPEVTQEKIDDIEKRRQEELSAYDEEGLNEAYAAGSDQTIGEFINAKYDAELSALQKPVAPKVTQVKVAPFFNTTIENKEEAATLRQFPEYKNYVQSLLDIAQQIGVPAKVVETIGGYKNDAGQEIIEISNSVDLENATIEQAEEFAALAAALAPEVQEASIAAQYVNQGERNHNANEYVVVVSDVDGALGALKEAGITDFSINEETGEVGFIDVFDFTDAELQTKIGKFIQNLENNNIAYEQADYRPVDSRRIGKAERKKVLGRVREKGTQLGEGGQNLLQTLEQAVQRDAEFQGLKTEDYYKPIAGNRLFNQPLKAVSEIANRYFQRVFGKARPQYYGSKSLDTEKAKRISDAFAAMKNDPNNPEVKAAYEALAKETLDQYQSFIDAGYSVEINNEEPYANSQEMIDDLKNRKVIKIFSTESGFGDVPITDKQRAENPLLRDSGMKDVNGQPMLINDVFRAIHDFFGHAELGNSFGPKGEENAWNVHARMFSPEARKAMTTETRGQNSYVNFSGVNQRIEELREQARALREEGNEEGAQAIVQQIYEEMSFADQKVGLLPEEFYQIDENDMGDADRIPEAEVMEEISQELTEADLPGYDRMMGEIEGVIKKSENRGVPFNKIMDNVMEYMKKSKAYENATDVQREALVRDIRSRFKKKEKRAPSVAKILGKKKVLATVDTMAEINERIKIAARAAREAKADLNTKRKQLADVVRSMAKEGKLSVNRVAALINKISKLNLDSKTAVDKFIDYADKLFADAEYANKLSTANTTRKQLRSLSKNKDKAANLRDLAKQFSEIDPSMVEDIDEYNRVASLIKESIKGSTTRGADVKFANMVKESDAMEYINKTMEEQKKKLFDMKVAEVQDLLGVDASDLTYDQLLQMLEKDEAMTDDNEKLVRSAINKAFSIYSTLIKESVKTGKDLFTGEDVNYTDIQKRVIKEFMDMDLDVLQPKQALEAVDALMNFMQNQSIAKMESVVAKYKGEVNMNKLENKGIKAKPISKYWSKGLGKLLVEQTANLNILFERMFGGFNRGGMVEDMMGVTAIKNGKSKAQSESNSIVNEYVKKFYKAKPNGKAFNTASNNTERGLLAFMQRNVIGTEAEMQEEFNRRKDLILKVDKDGKRTGSIAELEKGNEDEQAKAKVYQEVYDKILKDSKNLDEVKGKAAKENVEAVQFWQEKWDNKYEELSDVALGVYNKVLGKDINYTPDIFKRLSSDPGETDLTSEDMGFLVNSGTAPLYKKETGVLMASTRPKTLPKNEKTKRTSRYIDLSFDSNNANAMYDALIDINTAAPIRQVESALNSESFANIMKGTGDEKLLRNRIDLYVKNIRKKNPFSNDEFSKAVRGLNRLASIGVGQALGGVLQPIKQVIPIAMNTFINAGGLDINSVSNPAKQGFIDRSGYAIANRGVESQAQISTLNKMINEAADSTPEKAFRAIEKINNWWLKNLLVRFDVAIARASWMTYYEQSLQKQGIDTKGIDYTTHEVNQEAADYAQRQVDRQQNVSDADLAGALLSSKDASKQLFVKILMPFASFRMNQSARLGSDLNTMMSKTATKEDKAVAARSLGGFAAEMVTFRVSAGSALLIAQVVKDTMGRDDDEEKDQKKMDAIVKGQLTSTVADLFSPAPLLDKLVQVGVSGVMATTQDALDVDKEDRLEIYSGNKQDFFQSLGLLGIAGSRAAQLYEMAKLSAGGSYEDDYGRKKYLSEADRDAIGGLIPIAILSNLGLTPSEINSIVRSSLSDAKRSASTVEGGKSREDVRVEERAEEVSGDRKERREEAKSDKLNALRELRNDEVDADKIKAIDDMIEMLSMTDEEKKAAKSDLAAEKLEKEEEMKKLLGGYDNKTDLKRYDPELYEQNFGDNSEYYLKNQAEMEVEKELNKKLQELEDEKMGYTPSQKRRSQFRERIKSSKSRYRRESESIR
jgi:hypothetical protein